MKKEYIQCVEMKECEWVTALAKRKTTIRKHQKMLLNSCLSCCSILNFRLPILPAPSSGSYTAAWSPPGYAHTDPVWFARKYVQVFRTGTWYRSHVLPSDRRTDAGEHGF